MFNLPLPEKYISNEAKIVELEIEYWKGINGGKIFEEMKKLKVQIKTLKSERGRSTVSLLANMNNDFDNCA